MFAQCTNFNQPVIMGNNVINCTNMFVRCVNFNQPITIPNSVVDCNCMFMEYVAETNTSSWTNVKIVPVSDIYVKGNTFRNIGTQNMLSRVHRNENSQGYGTNAFNNRRDVRTNIYFNSVLQNQFNRTNAKSLVGAPITWTALDDGNGYYNARANIWLYNNYEG